MDANDLRAKLSSLSHPAPISAIIAERDAAVRAERANLSPWVRRNLDNAQFVRARGSQYAGPERGA